MTHDITARLNEPEPLRPAIADNLALPAKDRARLRVALFSGNYNCIVDGANLTLNRLVGFLLDEKRADVRVYSPIVDPPAFAPRGELVGVRSIAIPGRREYRLALGLPKAIRRDILSFAPNIVHLSAPDWLGYRAKRLARAMGVPVVASVHTRFETYLEYYGLQFLRPVAERYLLSFYNDCDQVLAPGAAIEAELRRSGVTSPIGLWGRGVDRDRYSPTQRDIAWRRANGYDDEDVAILFFGRIVREKGIADFADVIDRLRQRGHRLRPLIVGDGPERKWLEARLGDAVFTGHLTGDTLARVIASADIMFHTSRTEAFGNVVLEALASGLPVVGADIPIARAQVDHNHSGLLTAPTVKAYADALEGLLRDADVRRAMSAAARAKSEQFVWNAVLEEVNKAYDRTRLD